MAEPRKTKPGRRAILHKCPRGGSAVAPCCGKTPFELPKGDRITMRDRLATCRKGPLKPRAALESILNILVECHKFYNEPCMDERDECISLARRALGKRE